jgi:hypothetical protein
MNVLRVSIVMLFIATIPNVAFAGQDDGIQKYGTQETVDEPDCESSLASE